jgi:hypothetical protein
MTENLPTVPLKLSFIVNTKGFKNYRKNSTYGFYYHLSQDQLNALILSCYHILCQVGDKETHTY